MLDEAPNFDAYYCFKNNPRAQDFISQCLEKDPKQRKSASELLAHPWITTHTSLEIKKRMTKSWFGGTIYSKKAFDSVTTLLLTNIAHYARKTIPLSKWELALILNLAWM